MELQAACRQLPLSPCLFQLPLELLSAPDTWQGRELTSGHRLKGIRGSPDTALLRSLGRGCLCCPVSKVLCKAPWP